jgi:hypothetical protein
MKSMPAAESQAMSLMGEEILRGTKTNHKYNALFQKIRARTDAAGDILGRATLGGVESAL